MTCPALGRDAIGGVLLFACQRASDGTFFAWAHLLTPPVFQRAAQRVGKRTVRRLLFLRLLSRFGLRVLPPLLSLRVFDIALARFRQQPALRQFQPQRL